MASAPQQPSVLTAMGILDQPSSEHLASLELCLHTSDARAGDPTVPLASTNVLEFSVDVTVRSKAAGLPKSQLGMRMSDGCVRCPSCPRPFPT